MVNTRTPYSAKTAAYLRRETAISAGINCILTLVFFLLVFGMAPLVPVWGVGAYVFDFLPQGFMVAFMGTLVPSLLTRKAMRQGKLVGIEGPGRPWLPSLLVMRAVLLGLIGAAIGTAAAAAVLGATGATLLPWALALAAKLVFAAALAGTVTPLALRATLAEVPA